MQRLMSRRAGGASLVAVLLTVAVAACGSQDASKPTTTSQAAPGLKGTVTIGAVLPLTGDNATLGADQQRGVELAVDRVNASGGVLGKRLAVDVEDSEGGAAPSVTAATKLVEVNKVPVVIGEYSSGNTIAMGQYLQQQGVVHINGGSSSPDIARLGSYSFSTIGLDTLSGTFAARQLYQQGKRTIALMGPNNAYGTGLLSAIERAFTAEGGRVVTTVLYAESQPDYRTELQRIQALKPDAVAYTAYGKDAQTINRDAFQLGMDPGSFYGIYLSQDIADSDPQATNGQTGMDTNYIGPNGSQYEAAYKARYGFDFKTAYSGYMYDAVTLAAKAIDEARSTDPAAVRRALLAIGKQGFDGATGAIRFDADGQRVEQPYIHVRAVDGKVVQTG